MGLPGQRARGVVAFAAGSRLAPELSGSRLAVEARVSTLKATARLCGLLTEVGKWGERRRGRRR